MGLLFCFIGSAHGVAKHAFVDKKRKQKQNWRHSPNNSGDTCPTKDSQEIIIQCKAWKNPVGPAPIREMQGVKEDHQQVWVVGLGGFTTGAIEFAKQKDIKLLEYKDVDAMVQRKFASKTYCVS